MDQIRSLGTDWFDDSDDYTGPPLTGAMVRGAEAALGYRLPSAYIYLLRVKNGGTPKAGCFPTQVPTGWADDHVQIQTIFGIGGEEGIDSETGSRYLIEEWGYPNVGVVVGMTPSAGHEAIMLDYSMCGPQGEPRVIYVDTETADGKPIVLVLAPNFTALLQGLVESSVFEEDE